MSSHGESTYSLAERAALANGDLVTFFNTESRRNVSGQVLVALLVTRVLGDEVKVLAANDQSTVHFGRDDGAGKDTATDGDETSEGALLVCRAFVLAFRFHMITSSSRHERMQHPLIAEPLRVHPRLFTPKTRRRIAHTNVGALNGSLGRPEAQANILVPSSATLSNSLRLCAAL